MHYYVALLVEKLRYDLKEAHNKGKSADETWQQDRTDKGFLTWLIMMGQMRDMFEVMVLYGLNPTPCITPNTEKFVGQFVKLYRDSQERQDANIEMPDSDITKIFYQLQGTLKFTQIDGSKNPDNATHEKIKVKFQIIKSIDANLKVDTSTKKLRIGTLGLMYMCFMAKMCTDRINVPFEDEAQHLLRQQYAGCFSGGTKSRFVLIKFDRGGKNWTVENFDVGNYRSTREPNSMSDVANFLCGKNYRKKQDNDTRKTAANKMVEIIQKNRSEWCLDVDENSDGEDDILSTPSKAPTIAQRRQTVIDRTAVSFNVLGGMLQKKDFEKAKAYWETSAGETASELQHWTTISGTGSSRKKKSDDETTEEERKHAEAEKTELEEWTAEVWDHYGSEDNADEEEDQSDKEGEGAEESDDDGNLKQIQLHDVLTFCKATWNDDKVEFENFLEDEITIIMKDRTIHDDLLGRLKTGKLGTGEDGETHWLKKDRDIQDRIQKYWTLTGDPNIDNYFVLKKKHSDSSESSDNSKSASDDDKSSDSSSDVDGSDSSSDVDEVGNEKARQATPSAKENDRDDIGSNKGRDDDAQEGEL